MPKISFLILCTSLRAHFSLYEKYKRNSPQNESPCPYVLAALFIDRGEAITSAL